VRTARSKPTIDQAGKDASEVLGSPGTELNRLTLRFLCILTTDHNPVMRIDAEFLVARRKINASEGVVQIVALCATVAAECPLIQLKRLKRSGHSSRTAMLVPSRLFIRRRRQPRPYARHAPPQTQELARAQPTDRVR
jgi:hypothetical protein